MKLKTVESLSRYILSEDGYVFLKPEKSQNGIHAVPLIQNGKVQEFRLVTDETFTSKGKKFNITRRFTKEDVVKMFNNPKSVEFKQEPPQPTAFEKAIELHLQSEPPVELSSDQKAASKRVVKQNPKAKKGIVKKVGKAIQAKGSGLPPVAEEIDGMKVPFIRINGQNYQSARKASAAGHGSVNTVLKKAKSNKDGWFYIENINQYNDNK